MSVPQNLRTESKMEAFIKAEELVIYTLQILSNKNKFPEQYDDSIIQKLKDCAINGYIKAWDANQIRVTNKEQALKRHELQNESILCFIEMLGYLQIAERMSHISLKRISYWTELILITKNLLKKWRDSDTSRYGL